MLIGRRTGWWYTPSVRESPDGLNAVDHELFIEAFLVCILAHSTTSWIVQIPLDCVNNNGGRSSTTR